MLSQTPRTVARPSAWRVIARPHSSHAAPPAFVPGASTSADTDVPYADPTQASSVYLPQPKGSEPLTAEQVRATTESPPLTSRQRDIIDKIIRVDQAGELGANYIYRGQRAVFGLGSDRRTTQIVQVRAPSAFLRSLEFLATMLP
jgi:ubiquinone biosynthesis monooxygenase Coq7